MRNRTIIEMVGHVLVDLLFQDMSTNGPLGCTAAIDIASVFRQLWLSQLAARLGVDMSVAPSAASPLEMSQAGRLARRNNCHKMVVLQRRNNCHEMVVLQRRNSCREMVVLDAHHDGKGRKPLMPLQGVMWAVVRVSAQATFRAQALAESQSLVSG